MGYVDAALLAFSRHRWHEGHKGLLWAMRDAWRGVHMGVLWQRLRPRVRRRIAVPRLCRKGRMVVRRRDVALGRKVWPGIRLLRCRCLTVVLQDGTKGRRSSMIRRRRAQDRIMTLGSQLCFAEVRRRARRWARRGAGRLLFARQLDPHVSQLLWAREWSELWRCSLRLCRGLGLLSLGRRTRIGARRRLSLLLPSRVEPAGLQPHIPPVSMRVLRPVAVGVVTEASHRYHWGTRVVAGRHPAVKRLVSTDAPEVRKTSPMKGESLTYLFVQNRVTILLGSRQEMIRGQGVLVWRECGWPALRTPAAISGSRGHQLRGF